MPSYLPRVASEDGAVDDAFVIVAPPAAVRSRWVDDATGAGLDAALGGGVAATRAGGAAVVVAATRGGTLVVVFGAVAVGAVVVFGAAVVVCVVVAATRVGAVVVVVGAADVVAVWVMAPIGGVAGGTPAFVAVTAGTVAVFVTGGAAIGFLAAIGVVDLADCRFCHQLQPPYAPAATSSRRSSGISMLLFRGSGGGMSEV